jgi:glycosyltransferase involved in cell wall biosynthesis
MRISRFMTIGALPLGILDLLFNNFFRSKLLAREIKTFQPDIIHIMEIQHAGYLFLSLPEAACSAKKIILTNLGSDIYWFQNFPHHLIKIRRLLELVTHYSAECERDHTLASKYGFRGKHLPVIPNSGGLLGEIATFPELSLPSERKVLAVKGYSGFVGKSDVALLALKNLGPYLKDWEIAIFSGDFRSIRLTKKISQHLNIKFTAYKKKQLSHRQMLNLFAKCRVMIALSKSDGISTSSLEAVAMGAYLVQSDSSCINEWLGEDKTFSSVSIVDHLAVERELLSAIQNNELVDNSYIKNKVKLNLRLNEQSISASQKSFYFDNQ